MLEQREKYIHTKIEQREDLEILVMDMGYICSIDPNYIFYCTIQLLSKKYYYQLTNNYHM